MCYILCSYRSRLFSYSIHFSKDNTFVGFNRKSTKHLTEKGLPPTPDPFIHFIQANVQALYCDSPQILMHVQDTINIFPFCL